MKRTTFQTAAAAALSFLLPCAAIAAQSQASQLRTVRPQVGSPVSAHSIGVDIRNLPRAKEWHPGMAIREAHRRQYTPIGTRAPHAPENKPVARDRLNELQAIYDRAAPKAARAKVSGGRVSINNPNTGVSPGDPVLEVGTNHVI